MRPLPRGSPTLISISAAAATAAIPSVSRDVTVINGTAAWGMTEFSGVEGEPL